ncbi:glycosyltransferase family 4 protein [Pyxidicoccus sp. MSG2]|uniref:glycosyltransferase family 4 protein n=1 Tax=Pyxidicoccus sp. MSG2 TaxID=2996790 RepID=UPI00226E4B88|nr:glycosyltransferase family 4 protein [Pyxidicoccus sp. MSG2]MCY1019040.1 glycosyltransferase family 4 protein [Pyxidicoccus sp. MSG2]
MNFVFVGTSLGARGTETHLVCMVRALARAGHEVLTVARPEGYIARELAASGLAIEPGIFRNAADVRGARGVLRALRKVKADWLVGSFGHEYWPLLTLGKLTGTPVALFRHLNSRLKPMSRALLPRWADRFIAVSESMRSNLAEQGVASERVSLLYNPLDVEYFRPDAGLRDASRRALGVNEDALLVGFVGALKPEKGVFRLAAAFNQAMPRSPRLRALWVGEEASHPRLREAISPELQERHVLKGWTGDMRPLYAAMDVAVVPSEWLEPFGRVSIEAQASGVPVLASRIGGLPETLLEGETGLLLPPGDEAAWRDALVTVADMPPERRRAMGEAGMRFVRERFSTERIVEEFIDLLRTPPGREN